MYKQFAQALKWYPGVNECHVRRVSSLKAHNAESNLIIFRPFVEQHKVFGDWYWQCGLKDIQRLIEEHLLEGKLVKEKWRGRCGMKPDAMSRFLKFQ
jgi:(2Fe-2S) ferredoxin